MIAVSEPVDHELAEMLAGIVSDGIIAPGYAPGTVAALGRKKGGRFLVFEIDPTFRPPESESRTVFGVTLEQDRDRVPISADLLQVADGHMLSECAVTDAVLGMIIARYTQSNSVVYVRDGMSIGIGAGQQSRIDCTMLAGSKARTWWARRQSVMLAGVTLVSDGYLPFRDNVDAAAEHGVELIVEPGGSLRSDAVAEACREHRITLVHVSSDYVFDGQTEVHTEDEPVAPLGVYGVTKATADALVQTLPDHYIVRTSWVIGEGRNFVRTMADLARRGIEPSVVDDQYGRLTFTTTLADGIQHLLQARPAPGIYNLTNSGPTRSWFDIAREVFTLVGADPETVSRQTTADFAAGKVMSPRPRHSTLDLTKIQATGFTPPDADEALRAYLS